MDTVILETFVTIVDTGSIAEAARRREIEHAGAIAAPEWSSVISAAPRP
ncbi:hypothetical protein SAMN05892877_1201 [Rhizobium subbaraonis]|uniref:Uncharacterized protein n=1 Tax=Rhizobium subbaraonis TaxID=908946 RepID=A0A285V0F1_9HYPH|nr:LysR family transcriptional regulator [Rhizobium subbaraonis]SOC45991.1 hypothetical protein SAMN05892877_1201 [Rhizobium subbaraonis]